MASGRSVLFLILHTKLSSSSSINYIQQYFSGLFFFVLICCNIEETIQFPINFLIAVNKPLSDRMQQRHYVKQHFDTNYGTGGKNVAFATCRFRCSYSEKFLDKRQVLGRYLKIQHL